MKLRRLLLVVPASLLLFIAGGWYWLLHTESGARWIWSRVETLTDLALHADALHGDLSSGVTIEGLAYAGEAFAISVRDIRLEVDVAILPKVVTVRSMAASGIDMRIGRDAPTDEPPADVHEILGKLGLPLEIVVSDLQFSELRIRGRFADAPIEISDGKLAGRWQQSIRVERLELATQGLAAMADGRLALSGDNDVMLNLSLVLEPPLTGREAPLRLAVNADGQLDDFALRAQCEDPAATLQGRVTGLSREIGWHAKLEVPSYPLPASAGLPPLNAVIDGSGDLHAFTAAAQLAFVGAGMRADATADVDITTRLLAADLRWRDAAWPLTAATPRIASREGTLHVTGTLDDWTAAGTVELHGPDLPPGRFQVDARGDRRQVSGEIVDGRILGGTVAGRAGYDWHSGGRYDARLEFTDIATGALLPDWPAELNGRVDLSGRRQPVELTAELHGITGRFRDRPLTADGRIDVHDGAVSARNLRVHHGDSYLRLDGQPYAAAGLNYEARIRELGDYVPGASGSLSAAGRLSLNGQSPLLQIDASSADIGYGGVRVGKLAITDRGSTAGHLNLTVSAESVEYAGQTLTNLRLATRIDERAQSLDIDFDVGELSAGLSLAGALADWSQDAEWRGQVTRLDLSHQDFAAVLAQPADLRFSKSRASTQQLCVVSGNETELCADGSWSVDDGVALAAQLQALPVNLVNAFTHTRLQFDQTVSGKLDWTLHPQRGSTGRVDVSLAPGTVVSTEHPDLRIATAQGSLGFDIRNDSLVSGVIDLPLPELGRIAAEFELRDAANAAMAGIDGKLTVDISDIELLTVLLPALDNVGGDLQASVDVSGTLAAPVVTGEAVVTNGRLSYLPLGLRLQDLQLRGVLLGDKGIELSGSFRAGDGRARIFTRTGDLRTDVPRLRFQLDGTNLTVIDVPDIRAVADANIEVSFDGGTLDLNGTVAVPRAVVKPANVGVRSVSESDDVVIVAGELPDDESKRNRNGKLHITGSLEVALGDDVVVDLDLAQAKVTGSTVFTWTGKPMPNANGRYKVGGEILAFGQLLQITEGSVRFGDVPANDPYLRIRAEREIFGNTQVRRAGVLVAGPLSRPTVEAYTMPRTTEERALTLLVTGSDFDYEKGVGAVGFGTYIAPRVYASYGFGLFDKENVIRIRYDLTTGLGITATSGQRDSGVDLSYRIEN